MERSGAIFAVNVDSHNAVEAPNIQFLEISQASSVQPVVIWQRRLSWEQDQDQGRARPRPKPKKSNKKNNNNNKMWKKNCKESLDRFLAAWDFVAISIP